LSECDLSGLFLPCRRNRHALDFVRQKVIQLFLEFSFLEVDTLDTVSKVGSGLSVFGFLEEESPGSRCRECMAIAFAAGTTVDRDLGASEQTAALQVRATGTGGDPTTFRHPSQSCQVPPTISTKTRCEISHSDNLKVSRCVRPWQL
jgi:hypothetical protein